MREVQLQDDQKREHDVSAEAQKGEYRRDTRNRYLILGNGAAGYYAAREIRARDRTGEIRMISNEPYLPYHRPMLTKGIASGLTQERIRIKDPSWYEEQRIQTLTGKEVLRIDPVRKEVELSGGSRYPYDRLIYALGSECFVPPIPGSGFPEVTVIRRLSDVERLEELMKGAGCAVVIGGGVLGLEAAWELRKAGLSVTVLEMLPVLMGRQLDEEAGEWLKQTAEKKGVRIRTGVRIASIDGVTAETGGKEHVTGVTLEGGESLPADLVIVSAGVRAVTGPAREAGLETKNGVVVNERMETNLQDIYACGDCAEYEGVNHALWSEAMEQGKTAGANAAGDGKVYTPSEPALTFHGMDTALFAAGDNGKHPELSYQTMELEDKEKGSSRKFYFLENRLCGMILRGKVPGLRKMTELLRERATAEETARACTGG